MNANQPGGQHHAHRRLPAVRAARAVRHRRTKGARVRGVRRASRDGGRQRRGRAPRSPPDPGRGNATDPPALASRGILSETVLASECRRHTPGGRRPSTLRKCPAELGRLVAFFTIGHLSVPAFANASPPGRRTSSSCRAAFGLGLLAAIFAFGHISGGHFNPAVTIAMVLDKRTTPMDAVGYILSQIIGAIAAGLIVTVAVSQQAVKSGITAPGAGITDAGAVIIETWPRRSSSPSSSPRPSARRRSRP